MLKMLNTSQENTHTISIHFTEEDRILEDSSVKILTVWGKVNDERWTQLDDVVTSKLKKCNSLTERLDILQNSTYNEQANIFGYSKLPKRNLVRESRRTKLSIQLIKENDLLMLHASKKQYVST